MSRDKGYGHPRPIPWPLAKPTDRKEGRGGVPLSVNIPLHRLKSQRAGGPQRSCSGLRQRMEWFGSGRAGWLRVKKR